MNAYSSEIVHLIQSCPPVSEGSNAGKGIVNHGDDMRKGELTFRLESQVRLSRYAL